MNMLAQEPIRHTANCIICGKPAYYYTGYVRDPGVEDFLAGFCTEHQDSSDDMPHDEAIGGKETWCFGKWEVGMGIKEPSP